MMMVIVMMIIMMIHHFDSMLYGNRLFQSIQLKQKTMTMTMTITAVRNLPKRIKSAQLQLMTIIINRCILK